MMRQPDIVLEPVLRSDVMRDLDRLLRVVAPKDIAISLSGESGTGKEIMARRAHDLSPRRGAPFIPINCAAIPEPLFESELFGHERGAFTGANARAEGKLEAAAGGTLFLDEIGEMPFTVQAKLLRFLENKKFMRVGGTRKISVDIRVITASLRPLEDEVRAGRFRGDLFYRIQGVMLDVPPLRERRSDIAPLVEQFIAVSTAKHGTAPPHLSEEIMRVFQAYAWPGNARAPQRDRRDQRAVRGAHRDRPRSPAHPPAGRAEGERRGGRARPVRGADRSAPRREHPRHLGRALRAEHGNRSRAARRLDVSVRTMQRHVAKPHP
ncbi:MAG: sigma 54-interacting transcriptional regulator [Polyangiaceae bacterium]